MTDEPTTENDDSPPAKIDFHFIKSKHFRVFHCDGIWGGISPRGLLHISFFSERAAIPQRVTNAIDDKGAIGSEISRVGKSGFVREIDADVIMSMETARSIHAWLGSKISEFDAVQLAADESRKEDT